MTSIRRDCAFAPSTPAMFFDRLSPMPATGKSETLPGPIRAALEGAMADG